MLIKQTRYYKCSECPLRQRYSHTLYLLLFRKIYKFSGMHMPAKSNAIANQLAQRGVIQVLFHFNLHLIIFQVVSHCNHWLKYQCLLGGLFQLEKKAVSLNPCRTKNKPNSSFLLTHTKRKENIFVCCCSWRIEISFIL